jgi:hypothetical protein
MSGERPRRSRRSCRAVSILSVAGFTNVGHRLHARDYRRGAGSRWATRRCWSPGPPGESAWRAAVGLADLGARVVIVGREPREDGRRPNAGSPGPSTHRGDLSLMAEVRRLADDIMRTHSRGSTSWSTISVCSYPENVNSLRGAGGEHSPPTSPVTSCSPTCSYPRLIESAPSRVVNVSSGGHVRRSHTPGSSPVGRGWLQGEPTVYAPDQAGTGDPHRDVGGPVGFESGVVFHVDASRLGQDRWGAHVSAHIQPVDTYPCLRTRRAQGADTVIWLASSVDARGNQRQFLVRSCSGPDPSPRQNRRKDASRDRLWSGLVGLTGSDLTHQES